MNSSIYFTAKNWQATESQRIALDCGVQLTHTPKGSVRGVDGEES